MSSNIPAKYKCSSERKRLLDSELAYDTLKATVNVCMNSRADVVLAYTIPDVLVKLVRACRYSAWDVTPCNLTQEERDYAVTHGHLSLECCERLEREL
jgi:hypothetical protein